MAFFFLLFLCAIVTVRATDNVSPAEVYWNYVLPNTAMPHAIRLLLHRDQKSTFQVKPQCNVAYYAATDKPFPSELTAYSLNASFFTEANLYTGYHFKENVSTLDRKIRGNAFVPRAEADALPYSSQNLPKILDHLSIAPGSIEAKRIEISVNRCEAPAQEGEQKFCSTSLESLVDGVVSLLKTHRLEAYSTTFNGSDEEKLYKITSPIKKISHEGQLVICHPQESPQAVHYCHSSDSYDGYIVPLVGSDGSTVNAVAMCHHDVKAYNRFFLAVFNRRPDQNVPLCHFLPEDHLMWVHTP